MTTLSFGPYRLPGAPLREGNPLPHFRAPWPHQSPRADPSLPLELRHTLGHDTAFRVLPYRMQDDYGRERTPMTFRAAVLQNARLRATFLPELGGRLVSLEDCLEGRELLHRNPVFQPANLAIRNAWFSGGVEWNIGQFGHTFSTCDPLFAARLTAPDGSPVLRMYEYERVHGLLWQLDVYLPQDARQLTVYGRVVNPNLQASGMYWWTNTAVDEVPGLRVLAPSTQAITNDWQGGEPTFGLATLPYLPGFGGRDASFTSENLDAAEFFFQTQGEDLPFEAAVRPDGRGLFEASSPCLWARKVFVWGQGAGGKRWQEFLARPGAAYLELQAGLAASQVHGLQIPGETTWDWVQVFGALHADPAHTHHPEWSVAVAGAGRAVRAQVSAEGLARRLKLARELADAPARLEQLGSGWGALETRRRAAQDELAFPAAFAFPTTSLGPPQAPWLALLENGVMPEHPPQHPPTSFLVDAAWRALLERSVERGHGSWLVWLQLGIAQLEGGRPVAARESWEASLCAAPNAWALRNLAVLDGREGRAASALRRYEQASRLLSSPVPALTEEHLAALVKAEDWATAALKVRGLTTVERRRDRVRLLAARVSLEMNDLDAVEEALGHEFAVIREGETEMSRLWFGLKARQLAARTGRRWEDITSEEVAQMSPIPAHLNFSMKTTDS